MSFPDLHDEQQIKPEIRREEHVCVYVGGKARRHQTFVQLFHHSRVMCKTLCSFQILNQYLITNDDYVRNIWINLLRWHLCFDLISTKCRNSPKYNSVLSLCLPTCHFLIELLFKQAPHNGKILSAHHIPVATLARVQLTALHCQLEIRFFQDINSVMLTTISMVLSKPRHILKNTSNILI